MVTCASKNAQGTRVAKSKYATICILDSLRERRPSRIAARRLQINPYHLWENMHNFTFFGIASKYLSVSGNRLLTSMPLFDKIKIPELI